MQNSKIIEFQGKIIKRIFNPDQTSSAGVKFSIAYLILEWVTGPNGEYNDLIAIKTFSPKFFKDVRAGYRVNIKARYHCQAREDYMLTRSYTKDNLTLQSPSLFPEFVLIKDGISIIDRYENYEQHDDTNQEFERTVINPQPDDDLPF